LWNLDTNENTWSGELWELYGPDPQIGPATFDLWASSIIPEDRERTIKAAKEFSRRHEEVNIEYRVRHQDGSVHWLMSRGNPVADDDGRVTHYIGTIIEITNSKIIEQKLLDNRDRLDFVLEKSGMGWWELDLDDMSVIRSPGHDLIYGYTAMLPEWTFDTFLSHILHEDRDMVLRQFKANLEEQREGNIEFRIRRADGEIRWLWASAVFRPDQKGELTRFSGIIQDITNRKLREEELERMQAELQHTQKMSVIGQLAGGIVHDFNNMLAVILGNAELLQAQVQEGHPFAESLRDIMNAAQRSADLTRQLLTFACKQRADPELIDVNKSLLALKPMLDQLSGTRVTVEFRPGDVDARVLMDPVQFDQVISNLCVNAVDAIAAEGSITLATFVEHVTGADIARGHTCALPGTYVRVSLADDGEGIDSEDIPHIFEPFYTTKPVGKGTGLGLSIVYGIVRQAGGDINCSSSKHDGTVFTIYLPVSDLDCQLKETSARQRPAGYGEGTVLLVEDQGEILALLKTILEKEGYKVLTATDGNEALETVRIYRQRIDLLLTDVMLPKMNGAELYRRIVQERPVMKVLFMSGYSGTAAGAAAPDLNGNSFLQKPFSVKQFISSVYAVMHPSEKP